jgi:hypothetical protein
VNRLDREKRAVSSFVLTVGEKKVICFILLALILGLATKQYREKRLPPTSPPANATAGATRIEPLDKKRELAREKVSSR